MFKDYLPVKTVHPKGFDVHFFDDLKYRCTYVALDYEAELQKAKTTFGLKTTSEYYNI